MTVQKASASHQLHEQIEAARVLLANFRDILGDDAQAKADAVEGETDLREAIATGLARIAEVEMLETGITEAMKNLKARADRLGDQKEALRTALTVALELAEVPSLETPLGTISLRSVPPKLEIVEEAEIPSKYWKPQEPKLDKAALTAALKSKDIVPGAKLDNGSVTVMIRWR